MSLQFQLTLSNEENVRNVYRELINSCLQELSNAHNRSHSVIHEVRKNFKNIRGLFRLIRDEIGEERYKSYNHFFRDEARKISDLRDAHVFIDTVDGLKKIYEEPLYQNVFHEIREELVRRKKALSDKLLYRGDVLHEIAERVKNSEKHLPGFGIMHNDFTAFSHGLARVYQRARNGLQQSYKVASVEAFHDWRKRVKYLRHQIDMLSAAWPTVLSLYESELHTLTDLLGDHHDLAVLEEEIAGLELNDSKALQLLKALIHQRKEYLVEKAQPLGARLFAEDAKAFLKRIESYWQIGQKEKAEES